MPVTVLMRGICDWASSRVMSGSTPEADTLLGLGWKNRGFVKSCAIRFEATFRLLNDAMLPFA